VEWKVGQYEGHHWDVHGEEYESQDQNDWYVPSIGHASNPDSVQLLAGGSPEAEQQHLRKRGEQGRGRELGWELLQQPSLLGIETEH